MKPLLTLLCLLPFFGIAQKLKTNEFDKFIKQRKVEVYPLSIVSGTKSNVSISLAATGSSLTVLLSGMGWGASTIDGGNEVIFLLSNDSTVTVQSTGLQTIEMSATGNSYRHSYHISVQDLEAMSKYELVGMRKYSFKDYSDLDIAKPNGEKTMKLCQLFISELKKAKIIQTLKQIDLNDIASYAGDSVIFCSKVFSARYFENSDKKPTVLDVSSNFEKTVNIIIWDDMRKKFGKAPEQLFANKEVCISGVVQLINSIPQIIIRERGQIRMMSPIDLADVNYFINDSVTVSGKVVSGKYLNTSQSSPTLLNLGATYPDQLLTVVIENTSRQNFKDPENYYVNKDVMVRGRLTLYNGKPQIVIQNRDQIRESSSSSMVSFAKNDDNQAKMPPDTVLERREIKAEFPGGWPAMEQFLKKQLVSPTQLDVGQKISVVVSFLVSAKGNVSNVIIVESAGKLYDNEVVRVMKQMPNWKPCLLNGKPIGTVVTQKISFVATHDGVETGFGTKSF